MTSSLISPDSQLVLNCEQKFHHLITWDKIQFQTASSHFQIDSIRQIRLYNLGKTLMLAIKLSEEGIRVEYKRSLVQPLVEVAFYAEISLLFPMKTFLTSIANFV